MGARVQKQRIILRCFLALLEIFLVKLLSQPSALLGIYSSGFTFLVAQKALDNFNWGSIIQ